MNIKHALNTVYLDHILKSLGLEPDAKKSKGRDLWFSSPFRAESDASFHIDSIKNIWYDFGEGEGGNVISFAQYYLESIGRPSTVSDALNWLAKYSTTPVQQYDSGSPANDNGKTLTLRRIQPLKNSALIHYLKNRQIDPELVKGHIKEAYIYNSEKKKEYFGLVFANEKGGYEFRNKYIKSSIGKKAITYIKGKRETSNVHLFEGFMDFLTMMTVKRLTEPQDDVIILNSLSFLQRTKDLLIEKGYANIYVWFDNDKAGSKAKLRLSQWSENHPHISIREMNEVYAPFKDVNEWYINTLKSKWIC